MDKRVRAAVFDRADGYCECGDRCGSSMNPGGALFINSEFGHLDHCFGRAKAVEDVSTCWALHPACDRKRTDNYPSAAHWLRLMIRHFEKHGYAASAARARAKLEAQVFKFGEKK